MNHQTKRSALIVAGGVGNRMQSPIPKQFLELNKKPILFHTLEKFYQFDEKIQLVLVLPDHQMNYWEKLCKEYKFKVKHTLVAGGETRFDSVSNGLKHIPDDHFVAIHDGVRPMVSMQVVNRCFRVASKSGSAIPVITLNESLRQVDDESSNIIDRDQIRIVQTPQTFKADLIKSAYKLENRPEFTDDASVYEANGGHVKLVSGNRENIKITQPLDLKIAEALISD
ncbi:MAG: 2-C-methyl-D-erythritol 4-phosphate cytidylyltransferase [Bacteroidetes bacterium]|nr:2-C-methyl-D-erythritol 4-phosphate cytidylyltransferase [Bacteroidota bacterium]